MLYANILLIQFQQDKKVPLKLLYSFHLLILNFKYFNFFYFASFYIQASLNPTKFYIIQKKKMNRYTLKKKQSPNQQQTILYDRITKIQTEILQRIQKLKITTCGYMCQHFQFVSEKPQPYDQNVNYYDKFWKRFLINQICKKNVENFQIINDSFARKLDKIYKLFEEWEQLTGPLQTRHKKRKGIKQKQTEIFECRQCLRKYCDIQALNMHIKIKHKEKYQDEQKEQYNPNIKKSLFNP